MSQIFNLLKCVQLLFCDILWYITYDCSYRLSIITFLCGSQEPQKIAQTAGPTSASELTVPSNQVSQVPTGGGITEVTRKDLQVPDFEIPQADAAQEYYDAFEDVPESTREKPNPSTVMPDSIATFEMATYKHPANIGEENSDTSDESETEATEGPQTPQSMNTARYIHHRPSIKPRDGQGTLTARQEQPTTADQ